MSDIQNYPLTFCAYKWYALNVRDHDKFQGSAKIITLPMTSLICLPLAALSVAEGVVRAVAGIFLAIPAHYEFGISKKTYNQHFSLFHQDSFVFDSFSNFPQFLMLSISQWCSEKSLKQEPVALAKPDQPGSVAPSATGQGRGGASLLDETKDSMQQGDGHGAAGTGLQASTGGAGSPAPAEHAAGRTTTPGLSAVVAAGDGDIDSDSDFHSAGAVSPVDISTMLGRGGAVVDRRASGHSHESDHSGGGESARSSRRRSLEDRLAEGKAKRNAGGGARRSSLGAFSPPKAPSVVGALAARRKSVTGGDGKVTEAATTTTEGGGRVV